MLGNQAELWETALAAMKLRAVVIPATPLLGPADLRDRVERGRVRHVIVRAEDTAKFDEVPGDYTRIARRRTRPAGLAARTQDAYDGVRTTLRPRTAPTHADDPLMLYFTSGTTARPKLVEHTHVSYPVGHLATMYWIGLKPGDVHLNISSPGWAKHAWSNLFAPWNAEATVFIHNYTRFDAARLMAEMDRARGHHLLRAADRLADAHPGRPDAAARPRRARSSPPVSRSTPRSSSRSGAPGASPSGTASGRRRPPCRSPTARGSC